MTIVGGYGMGGCGGLVATMVDGCGGCGMGGCDCGGCGGWM